MKSSSGLYRLIYEYYEVRILYGYYVRGDHLPSISKMCGMFHLAPATVRAGLKDLEKKGYIRVDARKASLVVYEAESTDFRRNAAEYFVPRKAEIMDLLRTGGLVFDPLWKEGMCRWSEEEWDTLRRGLAAPGSGDVSMPVQLYIQALKALDNGLIVNLYWEIVRDLCFPYLGNREGRRRAARALPGASKDEIILFLQQEMERMQAAVSEALCAFIDRAAGEYGLERAKPVSFCWNIYRQRPQMRYTLCSRVIREIAEGLYPEGGYLPSLPQMAEMYGVGVNTVRRTLEILSGLGLVRSYHGKGTQVCTEQRDIEFTKPEIQEGLRLYRESLQLLTLTIGNVVGYTLESVSPEERARLRQRLSGLIGSGRSFLGIERILTFIEAQCPSMFVRECYGRIRELRAWGYPLALLQQRDGSLHREYLGAAARLAEDLEEGREGEFAATCRRLLLWEEARLGKYGLWDSRAE